MASPDSAAAQEHPRLRALIERASGAPSLRTGVVFPCEASALRATVEAAAAGLIAPRVYGPTDRIRQIAADNDIDLTGGALDLIDSGTQASEAARRAVADAAAGDVAALMKGSLHTDELLAAVLARDAGLRGERRLTHTFVFDVPRYDKLLAVTDAVVNISPDLHTKRDAIVGACQLLRALGIERPRVAIVAAVETVNPAIPATLDARELVALAREGVFGDALVEGPFGFDNAISAAAAHTKGIVSEVAGKPDLLLVPDLNAGNILYKSMVYLAGAECAGVVLGARVPVILTSRADSPFSRVASCALAKMLALDQTRGLIC